MGATAEPPTFADYRDAIADLVESGEPFATVEHVIDGSGLKEDTKDALWLFAFLERDSRSVN